MADNMTFDVLGAKRTDQLDNAWTAASGAICRNCQMPSSFTLFARTSDYRSGDRFDAALAVLAVDPITTPHDIKCKSVLIIPPSQEPAIPGHLSDAVKKAFTSAENNFRLRDNEDAAIIMYRRTIDIALKEKHPEFTGMLGHKLKQLADLGEIPQAMLDWAHEIKEIGNASAHEIQGATRKDMIAAQGFTDAFLRYFISLPMEVQLRRKAKEGAKIAAEC